MSNKNLPSENEITAMIARLTDEQHTLLSQVLQSIEYNNGKLFLVEGHGGTGKTFLWNLIISHLRLIGKVVLAVASTGIAALLMPNGGTIHSRFHIPLNSSSISILIIHLRALN